MVFLLFLLSSLVYQGLAYSPRPLTSFASTTQGSNTDENPLIFIDSEDKTSNNFPHNNYAGSSGKQSPMQVLYSWKLLDFTWPSDEARENAIRSQRFIPNNTVILDVDVYEGRSGRTVFVTLPRGRPGVPVTLATVSYQLNGANLLAPFPDWESQTNGDCQNAIISVYHIHIDSCGRLWVLDSGNNDINAGASKLVCPPQVLVYDLNNNNKLIGKYQIPSSMVAEMSIMVTIIVDTRQDDCSDAYAYIADSVGYKMIVFDSRTKEFWRLNSNLFLPYPDQTRFNVAGVSFDNIGGVFGLALGPEFRGNRRLYFNCIASVRQSWVDTKDIRNQSVWRNNMNAAPRAFNLFGGSKSSQSTTATMSPEGILFFGLLGSNEVACWNSQKKFGGKNIHILAKDDRTMQFISGIKVYKDKLYVASTRLQNYIVGQVPTNEENYRVLVGDIPTLTRGTSCYVDPLYTRFDEEYKPDSESVDFSTGDLLS